MKKITAATAKFAMIIDPIEKLHLYKDTSFALLLAAQQKQWPIYYMETTDLFLQADTAHANIKKICVEKNSFHIKETKTMPLDFFDVIFMRKDPPVDQAYWHATQILDFAEKKGVRIINKPQSLRDYNEKLALHYFPQLCPETLISADMQQLKAFVQSHQETVCKPLDGMGGNSVFKLRHDDPNVSVILETLTQLGKQHIVCQRYLPAILQGDKRLILINGKPLPYGLARMPQAGELRGNLAAGGTGQGITLSKKDHEICEAVGPFLKENGIFLAGLDVIGEHLTEINITSPTCIREISAIFQIDVASMILDAL